MNKKLLCTAAVFAAAAVWLAWRSAIPSPASPAQRASAPSAACCCTAAEPYEEAAASAGHGALPPSQDVLWRTPSPLAPLAAFQHWADDYVAGSAEERAGKAAAGIDLARTRRAELLALIEKAPEQALASAVPVAIRRQLPAEVQALLEERIDARGDYLTMAVSYGRSPAPAGDPGVTTYVKLANDRTFRAYTYGLREYQPTRRSVPVHGIALAGKMAVTELPGRVLEPVELAEAKAALGEEPVCPVSELPTASTGTEVGLLIAEDASIYCSPAHAGEELYAGARAEAARLGRKTNTEAASGGGTDAEADSPFRAPEGWTTGAKRLLVARVNFQASESDWDWNEKGVDRHGLSENDCREIVKRIGDRFRFWSYGRLDVKPVGSGGSGVTPVLVMEDAAQEYDRSDNYWLYNEVWQLADFHGYDEDDYDFLLVIAGDAPLVDDVTDPDNPRTATYSGLGYIGDVGAMTRVNDPAWTAEKRIATNVDVALHELGHNFGLLHSSSLYRLPPGGHWTFGKLEYGDSYDQMGSGVDFNARYKHWLRWLDNANLPFINGSGVHTIRESDLNDKGGARGLQIKVGTTEERTDVFVEYRLNGVAPEAGGPWVQWNNQLMAYGAVVRLGRSWAPKTFLMDATEETAGTSSGDGVDDSLLLPGRTFRTSRPNGLNLYITNLGADPEAGELKLDVRYATSAPNQPPTSIINVQSSFVGVNGKVLFTCNATDPDGDALSYHWSVPSLNQDGRPWNRAVFPSTNQIVVQFPAEGTQSVQCIITDRRGGEVTRSSNVIVVNNQAPTMSTLHDIAIDEDTPVTLSFTVDDESTDPKELMVTVSREGYNDGLFPDGSFVAGGSGASRTVTLTPAANRYGEAKFMVEVSDGGETTSEVFSVKVRPQTPGTTILPFRSSGWRYSATNQSPPATWMNRNFDDSGWPAGSAGFVYPMPTPWPLGWTLLGNAPGRVTTYYRREFTAPAVPHGRPMLHLTCDDGAVVYVNGAEVYRHNMPRGPITPTTYARESVEGYKAREEIIIPVDPAFISNGQTNVIAVEVHDAGSIRAPGDVLFDLELAYSYGPIVSELHDTQGLEGEIVSQDFTAFDFEPGGKLKCTVEMDGLSSPGSGVIVNFETTSGQNNQGTVTVISPDVPGTCTVTLRVSDGSSETWRTFRHTTGNINSPPALKPVPDKTFPRGEALPLIGLTLSDADTPLESLVLTIDSTNPAVLAEDKISVLLGSDPTRRWLRFQPVPGATGTTQIKLTLSDGTSVATDEFAFTIVPAASPGASSASLIPRESQWLMWAAALPGGAKPIDFTGVNLDDSGWTAVTTPAEAAIPAAPARVTTYFRRSFEAGSPMGIARLALGLRCDDGAAVYLNGTRIALHNLPEGPLEASTLAIKEVTEAEKAVWLAFDAAPGLLRDGRNVLAVELHQSAVPNGEAPGDPLFDLELTAMADAAAAPTPIGALIAPGSTWSYWDYPVDHANDNLAGRDWTLHGYDMGGVWKNGSAPLGYGTGLERTVINRFQDAGAESLTTIPSALFRHTFHVDDPSAFTTLHLFLQRDDAAAVYLNGQRILLDNLAPHNNLPAARALAPATVEGRSRWRHSSVSAARLRAGLNTIAVSIHQHPATEDTLHFDLQLTGQLAAEPELSLRMNGASPELDWSSAYPGWTVERSEDLRRWEAVTTVPVVDGPRLRLTQPSGMERGFFRLVPPTAPASAEDAR